MMSPERLTLLAATLLSGYEGYAESLYSSTEDGKGYCQLMEKRAVEAAARLMKLAQDKAQADLEAEDAAIDARMSATHPPQP